MINEKSQTESNGQHHSASTAPTPGPFPTLAAGVSLIAIKAALAKSIEDAGGISRKLVKFAKGDWTHDGHLVPAGTEVVVNLPAASWGWICFVGGEPTERRMGPVGTFVPGPRSALPYPDEADWPDHDENGRPKDPYSLQWSVPVLFRGTGEVANFVFSSQGGQQAYSTLTDIYLAALDTRGAACGLPIVKLQSSSYQHRLYGKTPIPLLACVGFTGKAATPEPIADGGDSSDGLPEMR